MFFKDPDDSLRSVHARLDDDDGRCYFWLGPFYFGLGFFFAGTFLFLGWDLSTCGLDLFYFLAWALF